MYYCDGVWILESTFCTGMFYQIWVIKEVQINLINRVRIVFYLYLVIGFIQTETYITPKVILI